MLAFRESKKSSSVLYAEKLYKRSSFYRSWSNSRSAARTSQSSTGSCVEEETLLAKALFDNLADAPDELSFRKGDIVTVIEQDVDGLVGWWLCLLHGRQGIVPGNRLKVLPSFDAETNFDKLGSQGSISNDDFTNSFDTSDGAVNHGPEYDTLPAPVKAQHGQVYDSPSPKTLKDVYTSESKLRTNFPSYSTPLMNRNDPNFMSNYDMPKKFIGSQSDYDIVPTRNIVKNSDVFSSPGELYDVPTNSAVLAEELYDVPSRRPTIVQKSSTSPRSSVTSFQNVLSAFTAIPDETEPSVNLTASPVSELYDTPKIARDNPHELYDVPPSTFSRPETNPQNFNFKTGTSQLYDVPSGNKAPALSAEDLYDIPPSSKTSITSREESSKLPPSSIGNLPNSRVNSFDGKQGRITTKISEDKQIHGDDTYDIPKSINESEYHQEIYDIPPRPSEEIYDIPPRPSQEIYDIPPPSSQEIYDVPPASSQEIYDVPPASSQEIYDEPPRRGSLRSNGEVTSAASHSQSNSEGQEIYDVPPQQNDFNNTSFQSQEIYDVPPSHEELYDVPPSRGLPQHDDTHDYPSTMHNDQSNEFDNSSSLYDVPTHHDINKVMSDISQFKTTKQSLIKPYQKHQRAPAGVASRTVSGKSPDFDDDDYVDYQDIYGKEPPSEVVKEMEKSPDAAHRPSKPLRKNSSFEQINLSAVKELKLTQKQAYDRVNKLHLAVNTSVTTLLSYSNDDWLEPSQLLHNIEIIKDIANKVKLALRLLTEFGLGTVVNAKILNVTSDTEKIKSDLEPLLECYYKIKVCLLHLEGCKWIVPAIRDKENEKFFATVNAIMILAGRVPEACRKLTSTLHYCIGNLFLPDEAADTDEAGTLAERMEQLRLKSEIRKAQEKVNIEKGKLKSGGTVDAKKVREILELDTQPRSTWIDHGELSHEKANGADMSPMEMKQEFQSRRQKGYNSTLPRRPPVPPKPNLPTNRRSMAAFIPDDEPSKALHIPKADTLVTDFVSEDGRKKYASDPAQSPLETEPARRPEWGGSCPQLDDHSTYDTPPSQSMLRATSSGTAASSTSTTSFNNSSDDLDGNANFNKMASDTNLYSRTMIQSRVTEPPPQPHTRSVSLPWDDNKITTQQTRISQLDHRDSEALVFFLQRVESQVLVLRNAVRNLTESVSNSEAPQIFVSHSKFVILTAHKVVHAGEELSAKLMNNEVKINIKRSTTRLADSIRGVVAGTKQAALDYPNQNSLMDMMTTVLSVGESVREVHKEAKQALEL